MTNKKYTDRQELLNEMQSWQINYDQKTKLHNDQYNEYKQALRSLYETVNNKVDELLSSVKLNYTISTSQSCDLGLETVINVNENNLFDLDKALSWSFTVKLGDDGTIIKKTSSWSGLQATTEAQLNSLKQTVEALVILNSIDWKSILTVILPKYEDFVTVPSPTNRSFEFKQQLFEFDINDTVGKYKAIKGANGSGKYRNCEVYYVILSETNTMYNVVELGPCAVQDLKSGDKIYTSLKELITTDKYYLNTYKITKTKFFNDCVNKTDVLIV